MHGIVKSLLTIIMGFGEQGNEEKTPRKKTLARQGTGIEVSEEDDEDGGVPIVRY